MEVVCPVTSICIGWNARSNAPLSIRAVVTAVAEADLDIAIAIQAGKVPVATKLLPLT